jgi:hypothetical protein
MAAELLSACLRGQEGKLPSRHVARHPPFPVSTARCLIAADDWAHIAIASIDGRIEVEGCLRWVRSPSGSHRIVVVGWRPTRGEVDPSSAIVLLGGLHRLSWRI